MSPVTPAQAAWRTVDYLLAAMIFALMGLFYWAIRGTGGYGGAQGGMLAGFGWAVLWYAFAHFDGHGARRPYAGPGVLFAITLGIAFGGMTGYGVYISWLQGKFFLNYPEMERAVAPWTGYAMLFLCGLHWGGVTGAFMAWAAPATGTRPPDWTARAAFGIGGALVLSLFVRAFPQFFLPYYAEGIYENPEFKTCVRALGSINNIAPHLGLYFGFLACEAYYRNRRGLQMMLIMGLGFALPFTVGGYWHTFYDSAWPLSWWKHWEMSIGLGGGLAFGLAFWLLNRPEAHPAPLRPLPYEALLRSGLLLWLPLFTILHNAYTGWCETQGVPRLHIMGYLAALLSLVPVVLALLRRDRDPVSPGTPLLRLRSVLLLQGVIIVAGYVVSLPPEGPPAAWPLASKVLWAAYTLCIVLSGLFLLLLARRRGETAGTSAASGGNAP